MSFCLRNDRVNITDTYVQHFSIELWWSSAATHVFCISCTIKAHFRSILDHFYIVCDMFFLQNHCWKVISWQVAGALEIIRAALQVLPLCILETWRPLLSGCVWGGTGTFDAPEAWRPLLRGHVFWCNLNVCSFNFLFPQGRNVCHICWFDVPPVNCLFLCDN